MTGKEWLNGFQKRHPELKLRQPEGTSINRIGAFIQEEVGLLNFNLDVIMRKYNFLPNRIYKAATSAQTSRYITALFYANAVASFIPPMLV